MEKAQIIVASCSRRSLELEQVKRFLEGNGYAVLSEDWRVAPDADLILLSTCGFTEAAEDFGFQTLKRVQQQKNPKARLVLGGCIPEINPKRVAETFDGPTFSPKTYSKLNQILNAKHNFETFQRPNTLSREVTSTVRFRDLQSTWNILKTFDGSLSGLQYIYRRLSNGVRRKLIRDRDANLFGRDTFYIQIQEGCSMQCSYCVICKAIGALRSKPVDTVIAEFQAGLAQGYQHFQFIGDNAGSYGLDRNTNMGHLLERILALKEDFTLDLTDINPVYLSLIIEPVKTLCAQNKLTRLYIPIQSANRRILSLMRRDCDMDAVKQMLLGIRQQATSTLKLGTSIIVGFPSETEQELEQTIEFCQDVGFDWVWCHSFSARPETPAAALPDQFPADEIQRRAQMVKTRLKGKSITITAMDKTGNRTCQG